MWYNTFMVLKCISDDLNHAILNVGLLCSINKDVYDTLMTCIIITVPNHFELSQDKLG